MYDGPVIIGRTAKTVRGYARKLRPPGFIRLCDFASLTFSRKYALLNANQNYYACAQRLLASLCLENYDYLEIQEYEAQ